jgi:hypothetical protein
VRAARPATVLLGLALAWPAASASADVALTMDRTATNLSAHHGQLVWTRIAKDGRARLVRRVGGQNKDVRVPTKSGLFDPDTGTSHGGHQVIVYTRCAGVSGKGCDIWLYNDGTRREHKVPGAARASCSEFAPSIWIGTIAFARSGPGSCPGLYVLRRGHLRRLDTRTPAQTDMRGSRVAYLYTPAGDTSRDSVRVRSVYGGKSRRIVSGVVTKKESYRLTNPIVDDGFVYWLQEDRIRHEFFGGRGLAAQAAPLEFTAQTFPGRVTSIAVEDGTVYYANGRGVFQATNPGFTAHD